MHTFLQSRQNQRGIGHIGIILAIVVVLTAGGIGWWVWQKNKSGSSTLTQAQQDAIKNAKCDYDDKDLCKFFTSWKNTEYFTAQATAKMAETKDQTLNSTIRSEGDDKTHVKLSGAMSYETITIGNTLYTKAGDTWYKQTLAAEDVANYQGDLDTEFTEPSPDDEVPITYKKIGTEQCGERTCFKYQIVDESTPETTQYLWFDNKDYQLRRMQVTDANGTYDATFRYDKVSITEPSPVKELAPNQYIVPGQSEPTTLPNSGDMPNAEDLQNLMNQYQ